MVCLEYYCSVQKDQKNNHDVLAVERVLPAAMMPQVVTVAFQRTVRVPDNDTGPASALPPGLGYFPIYKTKDHAARLPRDVVSNGGVFVPMYQREAMWIRFHATAPFMVKIYVGGDYVVVPRQLWLDGVAVGPGVVRQFVAMPVCRGYTVEAQLTGGDMLGGMQIEITPARRRPVPAGIQIFVRTLTGKTISVVCGPDYQISDLKNIIRGREGLAPDEQRFVYSGRQLNDDMTLEQCGVKHESTLHLLVRLRGGDPNHQLGIAAGGKISQEIRQDTYNPDDWLRGVTFTFPVHILNSEAFRAVTGIDPPPSPITAETYAEAGLPFFELYGEETSCVCGSENFKALKSVNQIDKDRGLLEEAVEYPLQPQQVVKIHPKPLGAFIWHEFEGDFYGVHNPDGLMSPAGPRRAVRTVTDLEAEMDRLHLEPWWC
ncbi:hypothetical protein VMCG_05770 [Cytospora schulzeri]|uniref:Ubiquitin-like domain-containing protein n=1 Tax=Cytospora schulzeri TaxID=448051 RepID=A0A423WI21_9PEZI|nr:hypothetical protein VMCG_05770 [Valsa malicola]